MAIYIAGGQWKIEGLLRKWLVHRLELVSEDSQRYGQLKAINVLLTSTAMSPVLMRTTSHKNWRRMNCNSISISCIRPQYSNRSQTKKHKTGVRKQALHVSKDIYARQRIRCS